MVVSMTHVLYPSRSSPTATTITLQKIRHANYTKSGDNSESANNSKYEVIHNDFLSYQHSTISPYAVQKPINIGSHMY